MANKESLFAGLHILMWAILMAQRTPAIGFADTDIEKAAAKSASAGKNIISVNQRNLCHEGGYPRLIKYLRAYKAPFCAFLWLKNPFNQRNLRLINDLRLFKALYICRETSTGIEDSLQIRLFMQNKANFRKSQMNITTLITMDYEKKTLGEHGKKQSQTNPNKAKFKKAKMNVTSYITKEYENKPPKRAPKKQSQTSKRQKPMQTSLPKGIMKKTAPSGPDKTNPNKPNLSRRSLWRSRIKLADAPVAGQSPAGSSAVKYPDNYRGVFFNRGFCLYMATLLKAQETHLALYQS